MKKDTYYFSHDATAKDDPKCMLLIDQLGLEGYGIFWVLIETLRAQPDYKCPLIVLPSLAKRYNTSTEKIKAVVTSFGLFSVYNEEFFFSESLLRRMEAADIKRKKLSEAGKQGNQKRWKQRALSPPDSEAIATQSLLKEIKLNKSKLKETIYPTLEEFLIYAEHATKENFKSYKNSLELKYKSWAENGWMTGGAKSRQIKNWKSTLLNTIPYLKQEEIKKQEAKPNYQRL